LEKVYNKLRQKRYQKGYECDYPVPENLFLAGSGFGELVPEKPGYYRGEEYVIDSYQAGSSVNERDQSSITLFPG